jgi:RNA polymerase sigma factor (sigma-70 family)
LVTIAANEARQLLRRRHRDRLVTLDVADGERSHPDPGGRAAELDLLLAVRRLPVEERQLLALRYVAGFDATEISRALGLSPSGVRTRLARLIARLRREAGNG